MESCSGFSLKTLTEFFFEFWNCSRTLQPFNKSYTTYSSGVYLLQHIDLKDSNSRRIFVAQCNPRTGFFIARTQQVHHSTSLSSMGASFHKRVTILTQTIACPTQSAHLPGMPTANHRYLMLAIMGAAPRCDHPDSSADELYSLQPVGACVNHLCTNMVGPIVGVLSQVC